MPSTFPSLDTAKLYFSWGLEIDYMVNWSITPEQYKQVTGKDYTPAKQKVGNSMLKEFWKLYVVMFIATFIGALIVFSQILRFIQGIIKKNLEVNDV